MNAEVLEVALDVTGELMDQGAEAVILTGSHALGEASPQSDIDMYALGEGSEYRLEQRGRFLVSISWRSVLQVRRSFRSPEDVGTAVPGWRSSAILADARDAAAILKDEANSWTWDTVGKDRCDAFVTDSITGLAEEVHKLVRALQTGRTWTAAVQRSILAMRLAVILSVHHRLLYGTENRLWTDVAKVMAEPWRQLQALALADNGQPFRDTCIGALSMYVTAAGEIDHLLDEPQRRVVEAARVATLQERA